MAQLLEFSESSYFPAFKDIFKEIVGALEEAQDISDNLKPISGHFESLETTEFDEIKPSFDPMFHTICLIWANSKYYCRPARIIVLLQEVNNLVIRRASEFLEPLDLFKGEPEESMEKIKNCYSCLETYQKSYEKHKAKVKDYFKNGTPAREWEFAPKLVFARYDKFIDKMDKLKVIKTNKFFLDFKFKIKSNLTYTYKEFVSLGHRFSQARKSRNRRRQRQGAQWQGRQNIRRIQG